MKGFCLAAFLFVFLEGTPMEQCIDYICTKNVCLKYKQRHGSRVDVSLYSVCISSFMLSKLNIFHRAVVQQ